MFFLDGTDIEQDFAAASFLGWPGRLFWCWLCSLQVNGCLLLDAVGFWGGALLVGFCSKIF